MKKEINIIGALLLAIGVFLFFYNMCNFSIDSRCLQGICLKIGDTNKKQLYYYYKISTRTFIGIGASLTVLGG